MAAIGVSHVPATAEMHPEANIVDWLQKALSEERKELELTLVQRHQDLLRRFQHLPLSASTGTASASRCPDPIEIKEQPAKDLILPPGTIREEQQSVTPEGLVDTSTIPMSKSKTVDESVLEALENIPDEGSMTNWRISAKDFLEFKLDIVSGCVIVLYIVVIAIKTQYKGVELAHSLSPYAEQFQGSRPAKEVWPHAHEVFIVLDWCFVGFFCGELATRIIFNIRLRPDLYWNIFDAVILLLFFVEQAISLEELLDFNPTVMRMARLVKLMRLLKLVRFVRSFDALHFIIKSIMSTLSVLGYSLVLIFTMMLFIAVVLANFLSSFIRDADQEVEIRMQAYLKWGSFWRALLSMFEITFANWGPHCWFLVDNVNELWGFFFIVWRTIVGFAVIQVITSVFIQHTFKTAQGDEDVMIQDKIKATECYMTHLDNLFTELDHNETGFFTKEDLEKALRHPRVKGWFAALEIDASDAPELFVMLDNGDGEVNKEEFLDGLRQIKGAAKRMDQLRVMKDCQAIRATLDGGRRRAQFSYDSRDDLRQLSNGSRRSRRSRPMHLSSARSSPAIG